MQKSPRWSGHNEHDRSGVGEETCYAVLCAGYEDSDKDEMRPLRPLLYFVKSGWQVHGLKGERW